MHTYDRLTQGLRVAAVSAAAAAATAVAATATVAVVARETLSFALFSAFSESQRAVAQPGDIRRAAPRSRLLPSPAHGPAQTSLPHSHQL